jgi:hypothetical protein
VKPWTTAPSGSERGATRKSSSPLVWKRPTPPGTLPCAVAVVERRGTATRAETEVTPLGSFWQLTEPSSAMTRMAEPGAQLPVTRCCFASRASAFLTISAECCSSAVVTSAGRRSTARRPLVISSAVMGRPPG